MTTAAREGAMLGDEAARLHLRFPLDNEEKSDGTWVARSTHFKSFAYGRTPDEASAAFEQAVIKAVGRFQDEEALIRYLNATGIHWWLESAAKPYRRVEVPVAL